MAGVGGGTTAAAPVAGRVDVVRVSSPEWCNTRAADGVSLVVLHEQRIRTVMVRMEPNALLAGHRHHTDELIYVLEGTVMLGDLEIQAGQTCRLQHDTVSHALRSESGCTLLLVNTDRPVGPEG